MAGAGVAPHRVAQCLDDEPGRYVPEQQDGELELREVQPHSILAEDALGGRRGVRAEPARTTDVCRVQRDRDCHARAAAG